MKIIITGASGNVGKQLIKALVAEHTIISVGRSSAQDAQKSYDFDFVGQPGELAKVFAAEKPDAVIHLAAILGRTCEDDPAMAQKVNVDATRTLAELAVKEDVKRFVFFSSAAVYRQTELKPTLETENVDPQNTYGKTKLAAEEALSEVAKTGGTQFVSLRAFNIYGPGFDRSLVYTLIHSTADNPANLHSFNNFYRDYIHVTDITQAVTQCLNAQLNQPHTVLNIASGVATNNAKLVEAIEQAGVTPVYNKTEGEKVDVSWADITAAKNLLGFNPKTTIVVDR